jgi:hypothetical protein
MAVGSEAADEVILDGDPPLRLQIPGGLHGDTATAAVVVNVIPRLLEAPAGLLTMPQLPPPRPALGRHPARR